MNISDLMTQEGFSAFLQAYHQRLHEERSFPPLGVQKALHTASPIFGCKNWQALTKSNNWPSSKTKNQSIDPVSVVVEYRNNYEPFSNGFKSVIREVESHIFANDKEAKKFLFSLMEGDPTEYLTDRGGNQQAFIELHPSRVSLEKMAEYVEFYARATVKIARFSESSHPEFASTDEMAVSFTLTSVGNHQSPFSERLSFEGEEKDVYYDLINLIINDIGAMDCIANALENVSEYRLSGETNDPEWLNHPVTKTKLFNYLSSAFTDGDKMCVTLNLRLAWGDGKLDLKTFKEFYEAAASVEIEYDSETASMPSVDTDVSDVVEHVLEMQEKYGFQNDEDSVREAVEESASLLRIQLNELEIVEACDRVLGNQ